MATVKETSTCRNMKRVIKLKIRTREELLDMCDVFLMNKRITDAEYNELIELINEYYPVEETPAE